MTLTEKFLKPIRSHPYLLILGYFLVFLGCLSYPTTHFTSNTDSSFVAPTDSLSGTAQDVYEGIYGEAGKSIIVTVQVGEGEDVRVSEAGESRDLIRVRVDTLRYSRRAGGVRGAIRERGQLQISITNSFILTHRCFAPHGLPPPHRFAQPPPSP